MQSGWKKDYTRYKDFFLNVVAAYNNKPDLKIYLELFLSLVTIVAFSIFAIRPTLLTIIQLTKEINDKEETVSKLSQKIRDLQTANNILQSRTEDIKYISEAIPSASTPDNLIKQIESLINENQVQTISFSTSNIDFIGKNQSTAKKSDGQKELALDAMEVPFTLSVTGPYQNLYNLISSIENMRRPVKVDSISINSNKLDENKKLIMTIAGRVPYIYKE